MTAGYSWKMFGGCNLPNGAIGKMTQIIQIEAADSPQRRKGTKFYISVLSAFVSSWLTIDFRTKQQLRKTSITLTNYEARGTLPVRSELPVFFHGDSDARQVNASFRLT
jgi:hypothetical protein